MDDDVQYIGTRLAAQEHNDDPCELHSSLTGVVLHVEKCADKPAHDLSFYRARSSHVNIGRKSGSDDKSMRRENDDHNAVFACQVVSAKHAKLVFSDGGQVYIVDLHSRHGTHLLRRGDMAPRALQAEVETLLADGDVVTFGKVVGAGSYHVSPVTARVELLMGRSSSVPSVDRALSPCPLTSPALSRTRKLSSGRYGLLSASCIESDSMHSSSSISMSDDAISSSPSEQESDVEEVDACVPAVLRDAQGKSTVKIPAFRSFISEIYHKNVLPSPCISEAALEDTPGPSSSTGAVRFPSPVVVVIDPFSSKSRSHSPMMVATPSASGTSSPIEMEHPDPEPAIIGAWPTSRPDSPRRLSLGVESIRPAEMPPTVPELERGPEPLPLPPTPTCPVRITTAPNDSLIELMHRLPPPPPFFPIGGPFSNSIASDFGLPSVPHPPPPPPPPPHPHPHPHPLPYPHRVPPFPLQRIVKDCVNNEIKGSLKTFEDRITALQDMVNDLRSRQSVTEDDMTDLQSQVEMLEPDSEHLLCRISGAERNIASLSTLQGQMTTLQHQVTALRGKLDAVPEPRPLESSLKDVQACTDALNNIVSEMKMLRDDVEEQIAKIAVIQSARKGALSARKEVAVEAESVRSLKRKRDDEESVGDETVEEDVPLTDVTVSLAHGPSVDDVPMSQVPVAQDQDSGPPVPVSSSMPQVSLPPVSVLTPAPVSKPARPTKRMRMAMNTVVHTAAAMAIGAAATWSALAFS